MSFTCTCRIIIDSLLVSRSVAQLSIFRFALEVFFFTFCFSDFSLFEIAQLCGQRVLVCVCIQCVYTLVRAHTWKRCVWVRTFVEWGYKWARCTTKCMSPFFPRLNAVDNLEEIYCYLFSKYVCVCDAFPNRSFFFSRASLFSTLFTLSFSFDP